MDYKVNVFSLSVCYLITFLAASEHITDGVEHLKGQRPALVSKYGFNKKMKLFFFYSPYQGGRISAVFETRPAALDRIRP